VLPDWQLPPGVDRGLWEYVSSEQVAREYDDALGDLPLLYVGHRFAERHFPTPGRLVELGCGTGRLLIHFAQHGFAGVGVDLSDAMLAVLLEKAERAGLSIERVKANLVELNEVAASSFDYAACMFSTLGMIRGTDHRLRFLKHVRRILKPEGVFVLHAHNAHFRFGRGLGKRGLERGDRTMLQHLGGAALTLHHFTRRELTAALGDAGFRVRECMPVGILGPLSMPWFAPRVRAYGYFVAAE
jgi:ubiquinone/menaquinone biosynthesis C-methylase UbiE